MKAFRFKKIDAFATEKSDGNPAGYVFLDSSKGISESEMQRIAKELKGFVSEVGYLTRVNENTFSLKYFSSEREVEFCGHATIAIMYDIIKNTDSLRNEKEINIITNKGQLIVENHIRDADAVFIMAPKPEFRKSNILKEEIASAMRIQPTEISDEFEIAIVNAGLETLIVPIQSLNAILIIDPDLNTLKAFCIQNGIDIIEVFSKETYNAGCAYRTRVFAPTFGYLEDPATGSGNSAFGYYLMKYDLWTGDSLVLEQNGSPDQYNMVQLRSRLDSCGEKRVLFGGGAVTRIEGQYLLT